MKDEADLKRILRHTRAQVRRMLATREKAYQTWPALYGDGAGNTDAGNGLVWVRIDGKPVKVVNTTVNVSADTPVIVGYDRLNPEVLQVLGCRLSYSSVPSYMLLPGHHATHEFGNTDGGNDVVWVQQRQYMPLRVGAATSGVAITVYQGTMLVGSTWISVSQTTDYSLLADVPTSGARYALISLDASGLIAVTDGTVRANRTLLSLADIPAPTPGYFPLAAVVLTAGASSLSDTKDIVDLRWPQIQGNNALSATQVGQVLFSIDGSTFTPQVPLTGEAGWLVDETTGILLVVDTVAGAGTASAAPAAVAPGLMITRDSSVLGGLHPVDFMNTLGTTYYRPEAIFLNAIGSRGDIAAVKAAGYRIALSVRVNGGPTTASTPVSEATYKANLATGLTTWGITAGDVIQVENEMQNSGIYWTGTILQYLDELGWAVEVAHPLGLKVSDGGLAWDTIAPLTLKYLYDLGNDTNTLRFANCYITALNGLTFANIGDVTTLLSQPSVVTTLANGQQFVDGYAATGADYVNFHDYGPGGTDGVWCFQQQVNYLTGATGLPAICNEVGIHQSYPDSDVTDKVDACYDNGLAVFIWYSYDRLPNQAKALQNTDGTLRPNGVNFQTAIAAH